MHVFVPLALLVPLLLELIAWGSPSFASSMAWLPLRPARRRLLVARLGGAYRQSPSDVLEHVRLPEQLLTPRGDRVQIDPRARTAWVRPRSPRGTFVHLRIADADEGFVLSGSAFPAPWLGVVVGAMLAAVLAVDVTGPSVFLMPAVAFALALLVVRGIRRAANDRLAQIADALAAKLRADLDEPPEPAQLKSESPSPDLQETPSTPPREETARRSSSSD